MSDYAVLIEVLGWIGSFEILIAYGLNMYQRMRSDSLWFTLLNFTGGIFMIIYTIYKDAFANTFINIIWTVIAALALGRLFINRTSKN